MLNVGEYGAAEIPEGKGETFVLEAGDLLYLPLFWLHSGVSAGESLSLSVVCPAEPVQTVLLRAMRTVMLRHLLGHQVAPALPPALNPAEESKWNATMAQTATLLIKQLTKQELVDEIAEVMRTSLMSEEIKGNKNIYFYTPLLTLGKQPWVDLCFKRFLNEIRYSVAQFFRTIGITS